MLKSMEEYLKILQEDEEQDMLPAQYQGTERMLPMARMRGLPHELEVKLMTEIKHLQSQPYKYLRLMNDLMPVMEKLQAGEFLKPIEAEEFLHKYAEFDKDVNHPRYFKLMKEFLTTGNWDFSKFQGATR